MDRVKIHIIFIFFILFLLSACATAPVEMAKPKKVLTPAEQEKGSIKAFNEILDISRSSDKRQDILPEMEEMYARLIKDYPDAALAQESYWRMIMIYVDEYSPPLYEKAESLYNQFLTDYPDSALKNQIERTLARSYYLNAEWDKLLKFTAPEYKKYTEQGKRPFPFLLLMYAEANFRLGNFQESGDAFKIILEKFPKMHNKGKITTRLDQIKKRQ
jgi:tetratricopeptide (TPR) repeat protein